MKGLDVFLIHGIEVKLNERTYYTEFAKAIRDKLPVDADVRFHPLNYSKLLEDKELQILKWMTGMGWPRIRELGCTLIGDVLAYAPPEKPTDGCFYSDLYKLIFGVVDEVSAKYPDSLKVVIGHSLGSQVAIPLAFHRKIDLMVLMGSPVVYFSIRYKDFGVCPKVEGGIYNFWRTFDPVSTILSRNPSFSQVCDIQVSSWNPLHALPIKSHTSYWQSNFVTSEIAKLFSNLLFTDDKKILP